jgi:hypothetical protein
MSMLQASNVDDVTDDITDDITAGKDGGDDILAVTSMVVQRDIRELKCDDVLHLNMYNVSTDRFADVLYMMYNIVSRQQKCIWSGR